MAYYIDGSAVVKLIVREGGSNAVRELLTSSEHPAVSCDLVRTEVLRAATRHSEAALQEARLVLDTIEIVALTAATCDRAGLIAPASLRSLDAVHLAAALALGDDLDAIVTYDDRMADGARHLGLTVLAPG